MFDDLVAGLHIVEFSVAVVVALVDLAVVVVVDDLVVGCFLLHWAESSMAGLFAVVLVAFVVLAPDCLLHSLGLVDNSGE